MYFENVTFANAFTETKDKHRIYQKARTAGRQVLAKQQALFEEEKGELYQLKIAD